MSGTRLGQVLAYAARGWPVFPCQAGQKIPATAHGHLDATTDPEQITTWFDRHPDWNLAIATGAPGPDVLDVDDHGPAGNGYAAFARLSKAGLLDGAAAYVRTPSGGLHAYFRGSAQRNGHLPAHHLDFRSRGGYVLAPPSRVSGKPYEVIRTVNAGGALNWATITALLKPHRQPRRPQPGPDPGPGSGLPGPVGRRPGRRQPQRGPVLGCQPRPGRRPRRRSQLAGRSRPPGGSGRPGDHQNPRFGPQRRPDSSLRTRLPARSR